MLAPAGESLSPYRGLPIYTSPTEILSVNIQLAGMGGAVVAFPVLMFSVFWLASPWLNGQQRRFLALFLPASILCFAGGAAFAYFVMLPTGLRFLLHFGEGLAVPLIRITEYMSLVTALVFWLGVVFELPLAMFLLAKLRAVSRQRFKRLRKYVPVAALVLSAIVTPTFDVVNQLMVAVPIWVLYEVGLSGAWLAEGGGGALLRRLRAMALWLAKRLLIVLAVALLAVIIWQLALAAIDGEVNADDWRRFLEDAGGYRDTLIRRMLE